MGLVCGVDTGSVSQEEGRGREREKEMLDLLEKVTDGWNEVVPKNYMPDCKIKSMLLEKASLAKMLPDILLIQVQQSNSFNHALDRLA